MTQEKPQCVTNAAMKDRLTDIAALTASGHIIFSMNGNEYTATHIGGKVDEKNRIRIDISDNRKAKSFHSDASLT
ncbi:MAG: hypothetical protein ACYC6Y_22770, partial [Thermoguttaceae bacterium]